ncbi:MAG: hypothetical protein M2R45_00046 [Verrucomicrobia subdivision 3 bacterium]|nr:hypothetical protein [Limisphaerales bacterium]MCS1412495.1 hypothetical protein [Limisphaerales bacterium]
MKDEPSTDSYEVLEFAVFDLDGCRLAFWGENQLPPFLAFLTVLERELG